MCKVAFKRFYRRTSKQNRKEKDLTETLCDFLNFHFDWQQQSFKKAFNFMQSLIGNPNQQNLQIADENSDESDINLDF